MSHYAASSVLRLFSRCPSWKTFTLTEFRLLHIRAVGSICSLTGINAVRFFAVVAFAVAVATSNLATRTFVRTQSRLLRLFSLKPDTHSAYALCSLRFSLPGLSSVHNRAPRHKVAHCLVWRALNGFRFACRQPCHPLPANRFLKAPLPNVFAQDGVSRRLRVRESNIPTERQEQNVPIARLLGICKQQKQENFAHVPYREICSGI